MHVPQHHDDERKWNSRRRPSHKKRPTVYVGLLRNGVLRWFRLRSKKPPLSANSQTYGNSSNNADDVSPSDPSSRTARPDDILSYRDLVRRSQERRGRRHFRDPFAYYRTHYSGLTRGQLVRADPALYQRLRSEELLTKVPLIDRSPKASLAEYRTHYAHLTRTDLQRLKPGLYQRLRTSGMLHHVPRKNGSTNTALSEYRKHYRGFSRSELFRANGALYQRLRRAGLLHHVPCKRSLKR